MYGSQGEGEGKGNIRFRFLLIKYLHSYVSKVHPNCTVDLYIGLAKKVTQVLHKNLWKNPNKLFDQPTIFILKHKNTREILKFGFRIRQT